jgi:uncharacterized membrane protein YfcA
MTELPWSTLVAAAGIVALAYVVYGLTGFGASMVAIPFLAHLFPLRFAVPMMLLFDLCAGLLLGLRHYRLVDHRELLRLAPWLLAGMAGGLTLLVHAGERGLLGLLGGFVLAYATWSLLGRAPLQPASTRWSVPAGLFGGAFTALFGTGGPIYTMYLARRLADKHVLRASIGVLIFSTAMVRLVLFTGSGFYDQPGLLTLALLLMPAAALGFLIGSRLHARLPTHQAVQVVWLLLILGGLSLLLRAWTLGDGN